MAFRVEITEEAERDANGILEWLNSQQAGETGLRWFRGLENAIASLAAFPGRCSLAPENEAFLSRYVNCSMDAGHMFTGRYSWWKAKRFTFSTSGTDAASPSQCNDRGRRIGSLALVAQGWAEARQPTREFEFD